ncbi:MAG: hypothetical protein HY782_04595 [Chloroflexi bacterium]|nr:hypothetical protein [Chloroflexota bacterium]
MSQATPNPERWKNLVVVLTILATVIAAIVAAMAADAGIQAAQANVESQLYSVQLSGELQRSAQRLSYEMDAVASTNREVAEATKWNALAKDLQSQGKSAEATMAMLQAKAAHARAERTKELSVLYNEPRYAVKNGSPGLKEYWEDLTVTAEALFEKQQATSEQYRKWNSRTDSYAVVLTVLTIALFLFALAQAVAARLRLMFAAFGSIAIIAAVVWVALIVLE